MSQSKKKKKLGVSTSISVPLSSDESGSEHGGASSKTDKTKEDINIEDLQDSDYEDMLSTPSSSSEDEVGPGSSKKGKAKAGRKKKKKAEELDSDDDDIEEADLANLGARLGLLFDAAELQDIDEEEERVPVDSVIEELLNKGLGFGTKKEKKLRDQITKLSARSALEITSEGRLNVLAEDVETVRKTKEKVDALIKVLEATRDKLIKEDASLQYSEPPSKTKPPKQKSKFQQSTK